jgi:hypothetical protein
MAPVVDALSATTAGNPADVLRLLMATTQSG